MKIKTSTLTLISGVALSLSTQAGESYSSKSGKEIIPPPAPSCLWSWFAGGSAGYVSGDWDEDIYTLHLGTERKCAGASCTQAFFLEVGYTEKEISRNSFVASGLNHPGPVINIPGSNSYQLDMEIIPITLNYKYECALTNKLNWYVGAGAGIALVDADLSRQEPGGGTINHNDNDVTFYAHIFAGLVYNVSPSFEIFGGARYIYMDDPSLNSDLTFHGVDDIATLDGDIQIEIGGRFNF